MSDKKIIITVRATADGVYGNYLYKGPIESDQGYTPGEVFRVDATPFPLKDVNGKPIFELDDDGQKIALFDVKGKALLDEKHKPTFKLKMGTFFAKEWMERVPDDTEVTYPDRPEWKIPSVYRIQKSKPIKAVDVPRELLEAAGMPVPSSVAQADGRQTQEVI